MPIYLYACPTCGRKREVFKRIADIDSAEHCTQCGFAMNRQIVAPAVRGDYAGYSCPITGKWIEGRRAHQENLAQHSCRLLEPGETEGARRSRAADDEALEASVEATVEHAIHTMPVRKREKLAAEIESGLDVQIERK